MQALHNYTIDEGDRSWYLQIFPFKNKQAIQFFALIGSINFEGQPEKLTLFEIVTQIASQKLKEMMMIIFCEQTDAVSAINWADVEFDKTVKIVQDFLASSPTLREWLENILKNLAKGILVGQINSQKNTD